MAGKEERKPQAGYLCPIKTTGYRKIIEIQDWGADITKVVVDAGQEISGEVPADAFTVEVVRRDKRRAQNGLIPEMERGTRKIVNAYVSNAEGEKSERGNYVTLEMEYAPYLTLGSPMNYLSGPLVWWDCYQYVCSAGRNEWIECDYTITQKKPLGPVSGIVAAECTGTRIPEIERFHISSGVYDGYEYQIADYRPEDDGKLHPLIVWLHGGGEGGRDGRIPLSTGKVSNFTREKIQNQFGGAYVLVPQAPGRWMQGFDHERDGSCIYEKGIVEMIDQYIADNPGIDPKRIYVGGCSNGGYLVLLLARDYPQKYAAFFPTCQPLTDSLITDEDIDVFKKEAIWFILSSEDGVEPMLHSLPTYIRIKEEGGKNVHMTFFKNVVDTSGKYTELDGSPYRYDGHLSWIYVYNDQVSARIDGEDVSLFSWMAQQVKPESYREETP